MTINLAPHCHSKYCPTPDKPHNRKSKYCCPQCVVESRRKPCKLCRKRPRVKRGTGIGPYCSGYCMTVAGEMNRPFFLTSVKFRDSCALIECRGCNGSTAVDIFQPKGFAESTLEDLISRVRAWNDLHQSCRTDYAIKMAERMMAGEKLR